MPRIRTIKPEHWNDRNLPEISLQAQLLWIGIWNFSDDKGVIDADPLFIKSLIFPRRPELRVQEISQWLGQLVEARFLVPFVYENESYYVTRTFETHQKIDKPQPSKIPESFIRGIIVERSENGSPCIVGESKGREGNEDANASFPENPGELNFGLDVEYAQGPKDKASIGKFIRKNKPIFPEPYVDIWNLFADEFGFPKVKTINYHRRRKFKVRIRDKSFDFLAILKMAKDSEFIQTARTKWFSFDWIFENDSNYLKVLEGNFSKKDASGATTVSPMTEKLKAAEKRQRNG